MNPSLRHPRLVGFAACLALLVLLLGLPAVLLALGWRSAPSGLTGWWIAMTTRDDGHLTLLILEVVAWIVWGLLTVMIITEGSSALRGREAPRLPGLRWSQLPVRRLVAAALLLFITVPTLMAESAPPAPAAPSPTPTTSVSTHGPALVHKNIAAAQAPAAQPRPTHTVRRGETLWSIAEQYLGSGNRYPEIVSLNRKLLHGTPGFLRPGWVLTLPAGSAGVAERRASAASDSPISHYTVLAGDTLSEIAARRLGDPRAWHQIFEASRTITQPDGRRLTDPNLILPGWTLLIPETAEANPEQPSATSPGPATTGTPHSVPSAAASALSTPAPSSQATATQVAVPGLVVVAPAAPATPVATNGATSSGADAAHEGVSGANQETTIQAPWLLVGLSGAGALLAAGLLAGLRKRRRAQFRARRPGRTIPEPPPELIPVEKTILTEGAVATPTWTAIDQALRLLAASSEEPSSVPLLQTVHLLPGEVAVQLAESATLSAPWRAASGDGRQWVLAADLEDPVPDGRAPYPLVVCVGQGDDGTTWMVNLELLGVLSVSGDPTYVDDFARYLAAEIAVNPWSREVRLDCVGIAPEAVALDPTRIHHHQPDDPEALDAAFCGAVATVDRCAENQVTAAAGRVDDRGDEVWASWLVLVDAALSTKPLDQLQSLVEGHRGRTGTAVALVGETEPSRGVGVRVTGHGRVLIPSLGLDLVAVGLTPDEAEGCAELLAHADQLDDIAMPTNGDEGWREHCDAAGALREDLVLPRATETADGTTTIPVSDDEVLDVTTATADDLQQLAPLVPERTRALVHESDPDLDADLAAWASAARPHLRLLGPIQARTGTTGNPTVVAKRKAFYAELLAFLALHPGGVSTDQLVDAFATDATQMRVHLSRLRIWLGVDPATGANYLPEATKSPAAVARGTRVYQLVGVLTDIDLFRRLRARGQARGPEGIPDLQAALALVTGEPFTGQRSGGWAWLADGIRVDHHMVCAVVDLAHLVTTAALHAGDLTLARTATQTALLAAPYEDTPRLDLAAILAAEGDRPAADRILRDDVANRTEDSEPPDDLPPRTADLVSNPPWMRKGRVA